MKVLFRDKLKSYFFVVALGLLAGFSVVFFIEVPDNSFWSFYYWSSSTFGFWMFSASLMFYSARTENARQSMREFTYS